MLVDLFKEIDNGGYEFFQQLTNQNPAILQAVPPLLWVLSSLALGFVVAAIVLFLSRRCTRSALVTLAVFVAAGILVEVLHYMVAARRPGAAAKLVAAAEMTHSFPAREVFGFTLCSLLLLFAAWAALTAPWQRWLAALISVLLILGVAFSNLLLQLHFVTDVVGGLLGGLALALLASRFIETKTT